MDPDAVEIRVLGCLLEKQRTTPDAYPLSLNALRAACNQSTNRDPVVDYDEATIREAVTRLSRRRWARLGGGAGSRGAADRRGLPPPEPPPRGAACERRRQPRVEVPPPARRGAHERPRQARGP